MTRKASRPSKGARPHPPGPNPPTPLHPPADGDRRLGSGAVCAEWAAGSPTTQGPRRRRRRTGVEGWGRGVFGERFGRAGPPPGSPSLQRTQSARAPQGALAACCPPPPVRPVRAQSEPVSLSSLDDVRLGPAGGGTVSLSSRPRGRRKEATDSGSVRGHAGGCAGRSDGWAMSSAARPRGGRRRGRRKGATDSGSVRGQSPPAALGAAVHPDPLLTRPSHGWFGSGRQLPPWRVPAGRPGALGPGPGPLRVIAAGLDFSPLRRLSSAGALRGIVWTDPSVRPVMLRHRYR